LFEEPFVAAFIAAFIGSGLLLSTELAGLAFAALSLVAAPATCTLATSFWTAPMPHLVVPRFRLFEVVGLLGL
jgi:hypothetical protein